MKMILKPMQILSMVMGIFFLSGCSNDDSTIPVPMDPDMMDPDLEEPVTEAASKTYTLGAADDPDISGTAKFIRFSNDSTVVELKLDNTTDGDMYPAHIHFNTAAEGGDIALDLVTVDGSTGESSTPVTVLKDGSAITYEQLLDYDGYINVHLSSDELGTLVAQGDIGQNELTGNSIEYILKEFQIPDNQGTATFFERLNGEALAILTITNNAEHPAYLYSGDINGDGGIVFTFNPLLPIVKMSKTNVAMLDDGTPFGYSDLLTLDGHIKVRDSEAITSEIIVQGNIGSNVEGKSSAADFNVTNQGATAYIFNGGGLANVTNPDITLKRGEKYTFTVNAPGHPFIIKSVQSTNTTDAYNDGVMNNGIADGTITFTVPIDAPDTLFYNCEFHITMTGELNIVD